jgi:hypothetical protein
MVIILPPFFKQNSTPILKVDGTNIVELKDGTRTVPWLLNCLILLEHDFGVESPLRTRRQVECDF